MNFTPKQDFECPDLRSTYLAGMTYTVREGNVTLAKLVDQWLKEGKVVEGGAPTKVAGKGEIK